MSKRSDKEKQLIHAAVSSFTQFGYQSTSIDNILDETRQNDKRISRRTYYKYFENKETIFEKVQEYFHRYRSLDYFKLDPDDFLDMNAEEALYNFFRRELSFISNESFVLSKIILRVLFDKEMQSKLQINIHDHFQRRQKFFVDLFTKLKLSNPILYADMSLIFFKGLLFEVYIRDMNNINYEKDEFLNSMVEGIMNIVRNR